ncbi:MAG: response regulator transcription factor [Lachnospiraceae bacterium]|nr:response regulator transcription factor [Lachnospiraceae bacterium]
MHYNCLIVDDEADLAKMTTEYFQMSDISTAYVTSKKECFDFLAAHTVDLLLLDINLGDGSGLEICKALREQYQLPILFISARQSDDDVLVALSVGGDDYVKKPYSLSVLLAKVRVNLRRARQISELMEQASQEPEAGDAIHAKAGGAADTEYGGPGEVLILDEATMSAVLKGERILLKAKEFALLQCLYEHKNTIVKKDQLFDEVWGDSFYSDGTLNVHIRKLREKLEEDPNDPKMIKTIWGTGYLLEV